MALWEVFMPCVKTNPYNGNESYHALIYYVQAETADEAEDKAEGWLRDTPYGLDDSPSASRYEPAKDHRADLVGFSHGSQQVIKVAEMLRKEN